MLQPLFPSEDDQPINRPTQPHLAALRTRHSSSIDPISKDLHYSSPVTRREERENSSANPAVELIRHKVEDLFAEQERSKNQNSPMPTVTTSSRPISRHQQFMQELSTSGKSLAQIQSEWHNYYVGLPDKEKYEVWQEFYDNNQQNNSAYKTLAAQHQSQQFSNKPVEYDVLSATAHPHPRQQAQPVPQVQLQSIPTTKNNKSVARLHHKLKQQIKQQVTEPDKIKQHAHSLLFGLGTGFVVLAVLLFGFFNEMIIAPFLQPSRTVSNSQIIVDGNSLVASDTPEVIIPKINVQIPVVYDANSTSEEVIQNALENGVVHYSTTVMPGEKGNAAIFGHSSNNIFNKGKYKFAFVLLHKLESGDIFYLTYNKQVYTYKVFDKRIVAPEEMSVMDAVAGKEATVTLITCDPPGTSTNRLVIWGEQINPKPSTATQPKQVQTQPSQNTNKPKVLPSQSQTLWDRIINWDF